MVVVLHADEFGPAVLFGDELHGGKLVGPHGACTDVVHFSHLNEVVQRFHCFGGGDGRVVAVDLEDVDVVSPETFEGGVDGFHDGAAGETCWARVSDQVLVKDQTKVRIRTPSIDVVFTLCHLLLVKEVEDAFVFWHGTEDLAQDDELLPWYVELLDCLANNLLIGTAGVYVGGIPCRDA